MAFDPTLPVDHSQIIAAELRDQFNGLKDSIDQCITTADMETEMFADTAGNVSTIAALNLTVSNPPTQAEMQALADKLDELIALLKRP